MKTLLTSFLLLSTYISAFAGYTIVRKVTLQNEDPAAKTVEVHFDLRWNNSWRDEVNYDAEWIFFKFLEAGNEGQDWGSGEVGKWKNTTYWGKCRNYP